jgi:stearoyl-CoA desaturase (delta-9 desaturase)
MAFLLPTICGYLLVGGSLLFNFVFFGFTKLTWTLNGTWCVNSVCHMFGTRPWNKSIEPADNFFVSLITMGEGWHNWHHEYPRDWRASKNDWWMINNTVTFLKMCEFAGLAKLEKPKTN